jgi:hypothetical protein
MERQINRMTVLSQSIAKTRGKIHLDKPRTVVMSGEQRTSHVCGRCGTVLVDGVDVVPFVNAALRCNTCDAYNDPRRPAKYPALPPMLQDVTRLAPATLRDWPGERWDISPHTTALSAVSNNLRNEWMRVQGSAPPLIHHYTTATGLRGILGSHRLWATDAAYVNDASEIRYGLAMVAEELAQTTSRAVTDAERELLRRVDVSDSKTDDASDFLSCFCADGDLLSQWRSYGSQGSGYSIAFNPHALASHDQPLLRRVVYDRPTQQELLRAAVREVCSLFRTVAGNRPTSELDGDRTLPAFASFLASRLREFVYTFKHDGFREEHEWRLILRGFHDQYLPFVRFRDGRIPVPYVEIALQCSSAVTTILPIVEVRHGPTLQPELAEKSLRLMLERHGYEHVEVSGSQTPLRA